MAAKTMDLHPGEWRTADDRIKALCLAGEVKMRATAPLELTYADFDIRAHSQHFAELTLVRDTTYHPDSAIICVKSHEKVLRELSTGSLRTYGQRIIEISIEPEGSPSVAVLTEGRGGDGIWQELDQQRLSASEALSNQVLRGDIAEIGKIVLAVKAVDRVPEHAAE